MTGMGAVRLSRRGGDGLRAYDRGHCRRPGVRPTGTEPTSPGSHVRLIRLDEPVTLPSRSEPRQGEESSRDG